MLLKSPTEVVVSGVTIGSKTVVGAVMAATVPAVTTVSTNGTTGGTGGRPGPVNVLSESTPGHASVLSVRTTGADRSDVNSVGSSTG